MPGQVFFFGPLTQPGRPHRGGPNAANERTLEGLRHAGFRVRAYRTPAFTRRDLVGFAAYVWRYCTLPLIEFSVLLRRRPRARCLVYVSSLYMHLVYLEQALVLVARLLGCRSVCEIRAGSFKLMYEARGGWYRLACRSLVRNASVVLSQDPNTIAFLKLLTKRPVEHVPNHVPEPRPPASSRDEETMRLIYFGALIPEKGVTEVVETCAALRARGERCSLLLLGKSSPRYLDELERLARSLGIEQCVTFAGPQSPEDLEESVSRSHFFLFPTRWTGEGHSNALTEAMARGVVPICSDFACNALVVGDAGRILDAAATPADYAAAIAEIWDAGLWPPLSAACVERIRRLYTTGRVMPSLIGILESLLS